MACLYQFCSSNHLLTDICCFCLLAIADNEAMNIDGPNICSNKKVVYREMHLIHPGHIFKIHVIRKWETIEALTQ